MRGWCNRVRPSPCLMTASAPFALPRLPPPPVLRPKAKGPKPHGPGPSQGFTRG